MKDHDIEKQQDFLQEKKNLSIKWNEKDLKK